MTHDDSFLSAVGSTNIDEDYQLGWVNARQVCCLQTSLLPEHQTLTLQYMIAMSSQSYS